MKDPLGWFGSWFRQRPQAFDLRLVARLLWVALALLAGLAAWEVLTPRRPQPGQESVRERKTSAAAPAVLVGGTELPLKPLSAYLDGFQRNPFTGMKTEEQVTPEAVAVTTKSKLEEITGTLKVVGVGRTPAPEALIEDTARQRTVVVKIGEEINGALVTDISTAGVVTVSYQGETKELH